MTHWLQVPERSVIPLLCDYLLPEHVFACENLKYIAYKAWDQYNECKDPTILFYRILAKTAYKINQILRLKIGACLVEIWKILD